MPKGGTKKAKKPPTIAELCTVGDTRSNKKIKAQLCEEWYKNPNWSGRQVCDELMIGYELLWQLQLNDKEISELYHERTGNRKRKSREESEAIRANIIKIWEDDESVTIKKMSEMVGCNVGLIYSWYKQKVDPYYCEVYENVAMAQLLELESDMKEGFKANALSGQQIGAALGLLNLYDRRGRASRTLELPEGTKSASITFEGTEKLVDANT